MKIHNISTDIIGKFYLKIAKTYSNNAVTKSIELNKILSSFAIRSYFFLLSCNKSVHYWPNKIIILKVTLKFDLGVRIEPGSVHLITKPLSFVIASVSPRIFSLSLSVAVLELPFIDVSIGEYVMTYISDKTYPFHFSFQIANYLRICPRLPFIRCHVHVSNH